MKRVVIELRRHNLARNDKSLKSPCCFIQYRFFAADKSIDENYDAQLNEKEKLDLAIYMHGRKNRERRDSVTEQILLDRHRHQSRFNTVQVSEKLISELEDMGLGGKKRRHNVYNSVPLHIQESNKKSLTGAGGFALHLHSASSDWPVFKHILPEIAFAGHSNSGKSTLVNAVAGLLPRKGPAGVSERAGWTDQICFYQLGKKPPILIMADLPGYGHAVASPDMKIAWKLMARDYLGKRAVLSRCCILVDSTRGLCSSDLSIIKFLNKVNVQWQIVLTKGDLLSVEDLAKSMTIVENDLNELLEKTQPFSHRVVIPVSAATGAGVQQLWRDLKSCASQTSSNQGFSGKRAKADKTSEEITNMNEAPQYSDNNNAMVPSTAVREHVNASLLRKDALLRDLNKRRTPLLNKLKTR